MRQAAQVSVRGTIEALLPEVVRRAELGNQIREALRAGDNDAALKLTRTYFGLEPDLKVEK